MSANSLKIVGVGVYEGSAAARRADATPMHGPGGFEMEVEGLGVVAYPLVVDNALVRAVSLGLAVRAIDNISTSME